MLFFVVSWSWAILDPTVNCLPWTTNLCPALRDSIAYNFYSFFFSSTHFLSHQATLWWWWAGSFVTNHKLSQLLFYTNSHSCVHTKHSELCTIKNLWVERRIVYSRQYVWCYTHQRFSMKRMEIVWAQLHIKVNVLATLIQSSDNKMGQN